MDLEQHYREWWRTHTPQQRANLQRGVESPRELVELTEDADGDPLGVETTANPDHGAVVVPAFVMSWRPEDDEPVTVTNQEDTDE